MLVIREFYINVTLQLLQDDLDVMRAELSKQCRIWRESPLRPDITKTKNLLHRISLRWQYLVQQATAIDVSYSILYQ